MDVDINLSPHFTLREFLHNGSAEGVTVTILENLRTLAAKLEGVRTLLGNRAIKINSGFRTPQHNAEVGGVKNSQHLFGKAADIVVEGMTPTEVYDALKDKWVGGTGHYPNKPNRPGWCHVDYGQNRRWEG